MINVQLLVILNRIFFFFKYLKITTKTQRPIKRYVQIRITNIENNDQCKIKTKITFGNQYLFSHFAHFKGTLLKDTIVKIEIILYMNSLVFVSVFYLYFNIIKHD
jgi:hypothetical protein